MAHQRQLVSSAQIDSFFSSTRRDAQEVLPILVRRLLLETTVPGTLGLLQMAGGDDIRLHGWDGKVKLAAKHPFVPEGDSFWEMGVGQDPEAKANSDYEKRSAKIGGALKESTFVFVTPHAWNGKNAWISKRLGKKNWKDIRVIDGQLLSEWLDLAPATAVWFHAEAGTPITDVDDVTSGWYRAVEEPLDRQVPPELVPQL